MSALDSRPIASPRGASGARALLFCSVAQVLVGGVRAVDASALVALARDGFGAKLAPFAQFLFDSPLKVLLLHGLGVTSPIFIGAIAVIWNFAPLLAVVAAPTGAERFATATFLAVLPTARILFNNVGVGDGVVLGMGCALVVARARWMLVLAAAVGVLWHFQQTAIIVACVLALHHARAEVGDRERSRAIAFGAGLGMAAYWAIRATTLGDYHGRAGWVVANLETFALRLALYWPVAFAVAAPGALLLFLTLNDAPPTRLARWATACSCGVAAASSVTTDISRTFFLMQTPLLLFVLTSSPVKARFLDAMRDSRVVVPVALLSIWIPTFSWFGVDAYEWSDLARDLTKYLGWPIVSEIHWHFRW